MAECSAIPIDTSVHSGGEYGARLDANAVQWSAAPDKEWRKLGAVVNTKRAGS